MVSPTHTFLYGEEELSCSLALGIARGTIQGQLSNASRKRVRKSKLVVENIVEKGQAVYGINTGFGPLCTTNISKEETKILQTNILKSHSVGVGKPIKTELAKLMLILKIHSLA